jgi:serine/threonine protein kinase
MRSLTKGEERIIWRKGVLLGKGACSKVWKGLTSTGELVAVKQIELLDGSMEELDTQCRDIVKEVEILKTLEHPNIVRYSSCGQGNIAYDSWRTFPARILCHTDIFFSVALGSMLGHRLPPTAVRMNHERLPRHTRPLSCYIVDDVTSQAKYGIY